MTPVNNNPFDESANIYNFDLDSASTYVTVKIYETYSHKLITIYVLLDQFRDLYEIMRGYKLN